MRVNVVKKMHVWCYLPIIILTLLLSWECSKNESGGESSEPADTTARVEPTEQIIEKSGTIEEGDLTDPNHMNFPYDAYTFEATTGDKVRVEVTTEAFTPLLKLIEVSTGAVLAEWDSEYPMGDALIYVIAGPDEYEARVYSTNSGTGEYSLKIIVE
ncbi:hypothetical protein JXA84_09025 [candidate division WOR-3 bacterium]|nr:hypothetical protein [candidate division WOR-3 bacterium]